MTRTDQITDLLTTWQDSLDQGAEVSPVELCRDRPDLLPEIERRLGDLRRLNALVNGIDEAGITTVDAAATAPSVVTPVAPPPSGTVAGYEVLGELGRGGMGMVYKARDPHLNRIVAIKRLPEGAKGTAEQRARFKQEAEAVARLQHPHIVQVFHAGEDNGRPFFVMEFVPGGTLEAQIKDGPQPVADSARLVMLLARAVHAAHQTGVIHRDLKPGNVLLAPPADEPALNTRWGCPKVSDFGLARLQERSEGLSVAGQAMGTPSYMAPEQAEGRQDDIGPATDVWALGVILYRLLAGRLPFRGGSMPATLNEICTRPAEPLARLRPEVPPSLEAVVSCCLQKEPGKRYPSALAMAEDLKRYLDVEVAGETKPVPVKRRKRSLAWAALLPLMLLVAGGAWAMRGLIWTGPAPEPTEPITPAVAVPFKGSIDILVTEPKNPRRQRLRLHEPGARPLKPGDEVQVEVALNRPGYVYVVWIDASGKPIPIYPWREGEWDQRPAVERPVKDLLLPEGGVYPLDESSPRGLETLVLLVRDTQLERDADLRAEIGELGSQDWEDLRYVAWFRNGAEVTDEPNRAPSGKVGESSNPAVRTQRRLQQRLGERFGYTRAVSFGNLGK